MVRKILKIILAAFLVLTLNSTRLYACGWFEYDETYRISIFRAEVADMSSYRPFYYTPDLMYTGFHPARNNDWIENCKEWNKILGNRLIINDIYIILYQVDPEMFVMAYQDHSLKETFEGNTFVESLLKGENKDWLDYLVFAKKNEYNNQYIDDPWNFQYGKTGIIQDELILTAKQKLELIKNEKLSERYAYHLIRLYRQAGMNGECIALYNKYFENRQNSVLKYWSMLHKAEALSATGKVGEANYLFSLIFNNSAEKKVRAFKLFDPKYVKQSIALAKNKDEIAGILALVALHNPGPALDQIRQVVENNPRHQTISLLIMREVNKLEDWIYTPKFTNHDPSFHPELVQYMNEEEYQKIKDINKIKDLKYLDELLDYLHIIETSINPELSDYLALAQSHLNLMADRHNEALALFGKIRETANPSILVQKHIELVLYQCFEKKINDITVKEELAKTLINLEKLAKSNNDYMKQLHSLCEILSRSYKAVGDIVSASLFKYKAEAYKNIYESTHMEWDFYDVYENDYYWPIAFLDRYADTDDIDLLIKLIDKKNKTAFEKFITNQRIASKNALLDLKGTLALRKGNVRLALEAFKKLPHDYWDNTYEFRNYLNHDPFSPPNSNGYSKRFKFNKADILAQLLKLMKEADQTTSKTVENYIKIGHFFYNTSYWGNSWMMLSYSKTHSPRWSGFYYHDVLFGDLLEHTANYEQSYYQCNLAKEYYQKAEKIAKDKEQKAMLLFMKYCCDYNDYQWKQMHKDWDEEWESYKPNYLDDLYKNYRSTETFREIHCAMMDDFAAQIGIF